MKHYNFLRIIESEAVLFRFMTEDRLMLQDYEHIFEIRKLILIMIFSYFSTIIVVIILMSISSKINQGYGRCFPTA